MKWKLVAAFATGTVLASVIVYFAVRPLANLEEPKRVAVLEPKPVAAVENVAPVSPPPPGAVKHVRTPKPVREKPSPFHPRAVPEKPLAAAKYAPPAPAPAPALSVPLAKVSLPTPKPERPAAPSVTLVAGTLLPVRVGQWLSSAHNEPGDRFFATLTQPLVVDGWVIAERGARIEGRVLDTSAGGLKISLVAVATSDGQNVRVRTEPYVKLAPAEVPLEARIIFKVLEPVTITERVE